jgi:hypothetical protein
MRRVPIRGRGGGGSAAERPAGAITMQPEAI